MGLVVDEAVIFVIICIVIPVYGSFVLLLTLTFVSNVSDSTFFNNDFTFVSSSIFFNFDL